MNRSTFSRRLRHFVFLLALTSLVVGGRHAAAAQGDFAAAADQKSSGAANSREVQEEIGDIRSLEEAERRPKLRVNVQGKADYTTNAKLQGNHSSGDVVWLPTLEVGYNVPLGEKFSLDMVGRSETAIYSDYVERSFFGFSGAFFLDYRHSATLPRLYVGIEPYWYQSFDTGDQLASAIGFSGGTDWGYGFNGGRSLLFAGYKFSCYLAQPEADTRTVHQLIGGLTHSFTNTLYGQVFYSYQFSSYFEDVSRQDSRQIVGANLAWHFATNWFGILTASLADNESTNPVANYQAFNLGLGVNYQY